MREPVYAIPVKSPAEMLEAITWLSEHGDNGFDPKVLNHPANSVIKVMKGEKVILYQVVENIFMLDAVGKNPQATISEIAQGLHAVTTAIIWDSRMNGRGAVYAKCKPSTAKFAKQHGMEALNKEVEVLRVKL